MIAHLLAQTAAPTTAPAWPTWLLELLSIDPSRLQGGTEHFRFARFPEGLAGLAIVLLLGAGLALVAWIYRREGQLARWKKVVLATLRCLLLVALALVLLYPVLEVDRSREVRATTVVLVDDSLSQSMVDRYLDAEPRLAATALALELPRNDLLAMTRADLVERALGDSRRRLLARLEEANRVVAYTFSDHPLSPLSVRPVEAPSSSPPGPRPSPPEATPGERRESEVAPRENPFEGSLTVSIEPQGGSTDLAGALRAALEEQGGSSVAGIVVFTDGRTNAGEEIGAVARVLRERDVPVHAVGVGDPSPTRNLRVRGVIANERVFAGDPIVVDVRIEEHGFGADSLRLELFDSFSADDVSSPEPVLVEAVDVPLREVEGSETRTGTHSFRVELEGTGRHRLSARLEPRAEELISEDNERAATVEVVAEASKVLLIAGAPSYEYRFLKNLLRRDSRVSLAAWLQSADADYPQEGNVSLERLPRDGAELFAYDVVCLLDPAPGGLPPDYPELLEEFVSKKRGGLLFGAGNKYTAKLLADPTLRALSGLLPITVDAARAEEEATSRKEFSRPWPLEATESAFEHAATRLSSQRDRNRQLWAEIAGFFWAFPTRAAKPGATVLFVHPDPTRARDGVPAPIVATQLYGAGRVMWCGVDCTWRWRTTAEDVYAQFWVQSLRYLTESRLIGSRRRFIQTDQETYELGEAARVSVRLENERFEPLEDETTTAVVERPDGSQEDLTLHRDVNSPGWFTGEFVPRQLGEHVVRLAEGENRAFTVDPPALEFQDARLDEAALRALAEGTGGSYRALSEFASLGDAIPDRRQTLVTSDDPIPLWDNTLVMGILAGLLTIEWILRKLNRLL